MDILLFKNLGEALVGLRAKEFESEYLISGQRLIGGQVLEEQTHDTTEYIILPKGEGVWGKIYLEKQEKEIVLLKNQVMAIVVPKGEKHHLHAMRRTSITFLRKAPKNI